MSMYGDYIEERLGDEIIETEKGFASFRFLNETQAYIVDVYVKPEFRKSGHGRELCDEVCRIAKDFGLNEVLVSVVPSTKNSTNSLKAALGYGMTLQSSQNDFIILRKEV